LSKAYEGGWSPIFSFKLPNSSGSSSEETVDESSLDYRGETTMRALGALGSLSNEDEDKGGEKAPWDFDERRDGVDGPMERTMKDRIEGYLAAVDERGECGGGG